MTARPHLLLCLDFPPMGGGIARWMQELALCYPAGGLVVSTGTVPGGPEADAGLPNRVDRLPIPSLDLKTFGSIIRWSRRTVALARETSAEFAWCGNLRPAAYAAWWARRRLGLPYGIILHGHDLLTTQRRSRSQAHKPMQMRALLGGASVLVANSSFTTGLCAGYLEELGIGEARARLHTVPLGTDSTFFRPGLPTDDVRARYQLPPGARWLVTVARLTPHKGADTALRALAALGPGFDDVRYLAIGSGPQAPKLRQLAQELGVADRFHLLSGVPDEDLPFLYNVGTLYLGLSRRMGQQVEGFGISLTEASASGLPVLGGRSGGVPDAVREGETGLLVDPEDLGAVTAAIRRMLGEPELARRLGNGGRAAAETYFNWMRVTEDLRRLAAAASGSTRR